jgi:hypothetical protein
VSRAWKAAILSVELYIVIKELGTAEVVFMFNGAAENPKPLNLK